MIEIEFNSDIYIGHVCMHGFIFLSILCVSEGPAYICTVCMFACSAAGAATIDLIEYCFCINDDPCRNRKNHYTSRLPL